MLLRFLEIEEPSHFSETIAAHELEIGYNYTAKVLPIVFDMEVDPLEKGCLISGTFSYKAELPCARCLEQAAVSGHTSFAIQLKPRSALKVLKNDPEPDEIDEVFIDGEVFETSELVKEQLFLIIPEKALCREDCRGLCPNCGTNLNETGCKCPEAKDPCWSQLDKLVK
jgi:uncharacterized protein